MHYFDHNATTPMHPAARGAWLEATDGLWHNPSSPYRAAARARNALELARARVAERFGCGHERVVFTAGATEGNNAVLRHFAGRGVAVSAIEHPSVIDAARAIHGPRLIEIPVAPDGRVQPMDVGEALVEPERPALLSLMAANNETGVVQPWREALHLARQAGVAFHCDAVQWIGRMPLEGLAGCDYVTASAHKFGGPKGVGFILIPEGSPFSAQVGGGQEHGHLWNTAMLIMPRHANTRWVSRLDRAGFQVSTGSACATGKEGPSHVLAAMGCDPESVRRAIRLSSGPDTTVEDWLALADAIAQVWADLESDQSSASVIEIP